MRWLIMRNRVLGTLIAIVLLTSGAIAGQAPSPGPEAAPPAKPYTTADVAPRTINNFLLVQSRDYVTILNEQAHDARMIPLDGRPHLPALHPNWSRHARLRVHGDRSGVVREAVDRVDSDASNEWEALRMRLPRRQLRDGRDSGRRARRGTGLLGGSANQLGRKLLLTGMSAVQ